MLTAAEQEPAIRQPLASQLWDSLRRKNVNCECPTLSQILMHNSIPAILHSHAYACNVDSLMMQMQMLQLLPPEPVSASPCRPLLTRQHRDIAARLTAVAASARGSPESTTSRINALQGLACARGLPTREITDLKRRNLQVRRMHAGAVLHVCTAFVGVLILYARPARSARHVTWQV